MWDMFVAFSLTPVGQILLGLLAALVVGGTFWKLYELMNEGRL
jgi:hypothetical protein